jgi:DNA-binding NtrC family response regulator
VRLLVLDGSRLLQTVVRHLAPTDVEVEEALSFDQAVSRLRADPPDALIVNVIPVDLNWHDLKSFCESHSPRIPVLFESCVYRSPEEAGLGALDDTASFLTKPYHVETLREEIDRLVASARSLSHSSAPTSKS